MKRINYRSSVFLLGLLLSGCAGSSNLTADRDLAFQAYAQGDYQNACVQLELLAGKISKDADIWFKMGNACAKAQYPQKAVEAYQKAVLRDPEMSKAWYNMGIVQLQAALKTFIEMNQYAGEDRAVHMQGQKLRDALLLLLEGSGNQHKGNE